MEARFPHLFYSLVFSCIFICTGCVNEIASETSEIQEGNIPITFSVEIEKSTTKVTDDVFDANDKIGLYALITGNTMADERYIDNLLLTCGKDQNLISERDVFYPEGDNTLDFIAYYPYNSEGVKEEQAIIPVSIQPNQEEATDFSASDFMTASKQRVSGSSKPVSLEFEHRLSKLKIILIPSNSKEADEMLKNDPHIIATGFYTQANYDLEKDEFTGFKNAADITPTGKWEVESGKLIGKEFIILPQEINDEQFFQIDWNGRIYTCPIPSSVETLDGNKQYEIEINMEESESSQLSGLLASISKWPAADELEDVDSENGAQILHLSALSFEASNVYRVHLKGKEVAEICKEYLADDLDSRAITIYPVQNGVADLENGTILQLLDTDEEINGGELQWDLSDNTFSYYEDDLPAIQVIYFDQDGNLHTDDDAIQPAEINVVAYTLTDRRNSTDIQQYPIVKIGTQYWLRENLRADRYSDGELMEERTIATGDAGYHINKEGDYFYNGEALKAGTISPKGWGIPSASDWESLDKYIEGDVSMLKTGEWGIFNVNKDDLEVAAINNKTMLSLKPVGNWSNNPDKPNINMGTMATFWTWDYDRNDIPEQTVFFIGESNEVNMQPTISGFGDFYKGLSLRLIKK